MSNPFVVVTFLLVALAPLKSSTAQFLRAPAEEDKRLEFLVGDCGSTRREKKSARFSVASSLR